MAISLLRGVPVLALDDMRSPIKKGFDNGPRFRPVFVSCWDELEMLCGEPGFCVIGLTHLDDAESLSRIRRLELLCPWVEVVVAIPRSVGVASVVEEPEDVPAAALVSLPNAASEFPGVLARVSFDVRRRSLRRRISDHRALPDGLRGTLWQFLGLGPEGAVDGYAPVARNVGISPRTARRQARLVGLSLRSVRNGWLGVTVAEAREFEGLRWETLRGRVGYAWLSSLCGLYSRAFDMTLRDVDAQTAERLLARFGDEVLGPLWAFHEKEVVR